MNAPEANRRPLPAAVLETLRGLLGDRVTTGASVREQHGRDESAYPAMPPDAVAFPMSTGEVAAIARLCHAHDVPMIPYGVGSSVEGHVLALRGGVSIDLAQMSAVLAVHAEDLDAVVQPGVTRKRLNDALKGTGLFFPLDPGADATLGGMAATRASGTNAVRYGTMRENVLALTVVLADGTVLRTGTRARKSSAGYDLTRLFVGSEGTLGTITEITVRIHPQPEAISAATCQFPTVRDAVETVIRTIQLGVPIARCELLDAASIRAINRHSRLGLAEAPMLFFEFHGSPAGVAEQAEAVQALAAEHGGMGFEWSATPEERSRLWTARHNCYFACLNLRPGARVVSTDVCVPISRLADCIAETEADARASGLPIILLGHVGDGNFHLGINIDPASHAEIERAEDLNRRVVARAIAMGGTSTGEHGIGLGKLEFLEAEHGAAAVATMRAVKRALDPKNLMNPGKVLPR
ncbi:MAG TPA: FAD-linked oxidase C-terminal domain-containing protein [Burkholderiales bacterium]|nr:FAD-linked oxidase C-terminal domain-containing protein [Burkholderiales bacterium]